jgi:hypothetical protein
VFGSRAKVTPSTALTYAVAGDSITAWPGSWKDQLDDPGLNFAGGFAEDGATTAHVLAHTRPTPADVLVIMLGTNDVKFDVPFTELVDNIERIAATAGCKSTLLCLLPPSNHTRGTINRRTNGVVANRHLYDLGARRGWIVADPFAFARASNNAWGGGASDDGTHPLEHVSNEAARRLQLFIRQAAATAGLAIAS